MPKRRDPNLDRDFNPGNDLPDVTDSLPKHIRPLTNTSPVAVDGLMVKTAPDLLRTQGETPIQRGVDARLKGFSLEESMDSEKEFTDKSLNALGYHGIGRAPRELPHVKGSLAAHYATHGFPNQGPHTSAPISTARVTKPEPVLT